MLLEPPLDFANGKRSDATQPAEALAALARQVSGQALPRVDPGLAEEIRRSSAQSRKVAAGFKSVGSAGAPLALSQVVYPLGKNVTLSDKLGDFLFDAHSFARL